jgi:hypothetical protein
MSDEQRRSSFASTAMAGRPQGEHQALASGLVEGHEQPVPSIEPDTIDHWLSQQHAVLFYWSEKVFK